MRRALWLPVTALAAVTAWAGALAGGVRVNWTPSLPVGLWSLAPAPKALRAGHIAEFCLPPAVAALAIERRYVGAGRCPDGSMPLLKPVAAVAGDTVEVTASDVLVNGRQVVPAGIARDSQARPMTPVPPGQYRVAEGQAWLLSAYNPNSFDSRYWGPIPASLVLRVAHPLLTF